MATQKLQIKVISVLTLFFVFLSFNGLNFGYVPILYDQQRLLLIILLSVNAIFFAYQRIFSVAFFKCYFIFFFPALFFIIFKTDYFFLFDVINCFLLALFVLSLSVFFDIHKMFKILVFFPVLNIVFLLFSLIGFFYTFEIKDWHLNYSNIRLYDSALLPIIFYIFYLLGNQKKTIQSVFLSILAILYILSLFFDGARSVLVSILLGLFLSALIYRNSVNFWKVVRKPFIIFLSALVIYVGYMAVIYIFYDGLLKDSVVRTTTSLRFDIWLYTIKAWLQNPFWGNGGGSLLWLNDGNFSVLHPHNFIILWLTEYGAVGFLQLIMFFYFFIQMFNNRKLISPILFAGFIALVIDGLLSGSMVYPDTQLLIVLFLGLIMSEVILKKNIIVYGNKKNILSIQAFILSAVFLLLTLFWQDLQCFNCIGEGVHSPRIWEYGQNLHLQHK